MNGLSRRIGLAVAMMLMLVGFVTLIFLLLGYDIAPASRICPP